jgi:hypothetical protein
MSNTTIQLKHSVEEGSIPVSLSNGELAINSFDGKIFYQTPTGEMRTFERFNGPGGLDTEIQFNDSGVLNGQSTLTYNKSTGALTVNGLNVASAITSSFNHANGAFDQANSAITLAQNAYDQANVGGGGGEAFYANSEYWIGSGVQSVFSTVSEAVIIANNSVVTLDGLIQVPGLHYVTSANSISFYSTPTLNTVIEIRTLQNMSTGVQFAGVSQSDSISYAIALGS